MKKSKILLAAGLAVMLGLTAQANGHVVMAETTANAEDSGILRIAKQGIFSSGGTVTSTEGTFDPVNGQYDPAGQTNYADHANVLYQIPADFNGHAMVFLHGYGQS